MDVSIKKTTSVGMSVTPRMSQLTLFTRYRDGRVEEPQDGELIICYFLIETKDDLPMFVKRYIEYDGLTICGPTLSTYRKKFVEDGTHRKVAFWQPVEKLPGT